MWKVESRYMAGRQKLSRTDAINDFKRRECKHTLGAWSEAGERAPPSQKCADIIKDWCRRDGL